MNLCHIGASFKTPLRYKADSSIRNHLRTTMSASALLWNVPSWNSRMKLRALHCISTSHFDYPVTQRHTPEQRTPQSFLLN